MIIRQPNGKYCYFGYNGSVVKNLNESDYLLLKSKEAMEMAKKEMDNCSSSPAELIKWHKISDEDLKDMGYEKTYDELMAYIPKRVVETTYSGRDCCTYGHCPACNASVSSGIWGTAKKCFNCGQALQWD